MKKPIKFSFLILLTILSTLFSCSTDGDDTQNTTNQLVGTWQRIDSNNSFENKFVFEADNSGIKIYSENHVDGTAISNAVSLEWSSSNNNLFILSNEDINTPYSFNDAGQLILSAVSEIPFVRID